MLFGRDNIQWFSICCQYREFPCRRTEKGVTVDAIQLSEEHDANIASVRDELRSLHPHDSQIVVQRHKIWRVKGLGEVSRSIGDAYMKRAEFNKKPLPARYRVAEPFSKPILSAEPSIHVHKINTTDQFIIFGSNGFWEHLNNEEAVHIVSNYRHYGVGKRLVKAALWEALKKRGSRRYSLLKKIGSSSRRNFHDDITVVVVFLDHSLSLITGSSAYRSSIVSISATVPASAYS